LAACGGGICLPGELLLPPLFSAVLRRGDLLRCDMVFHVLAGGGHRGTQKRLVLLGALDGGADRIRAQPDLAEQGRRGGVSEGARGAVVVRDAEDGRGDDLPLPGG